MSTEYLTNLDPRIEQAIEELKGMLLQEYPDATFEIASGQDDPEAIHLITAVDVDNLNSVLDVVIDRVVTLQVEEGIPVYVIPVRPLERALEDLRSQQQGPGPKMDWRAIDHPYAITVTFEPSTLAKLEKQAQKKGMSPTTLAWMWISERLDAEEDQSHSDS